MEKNNNNELLTRGISAIYPSKDFLASKIAKGEKLTLYLGIDPTGPTLHLGHAIPIKKLAEFQKMGHKIILLMGDFTAMIGDPTDKGAARKQLTHKEVMSNLKNYKKQASKLLSFTGKNKAEFKFNSKWLSKMNFNDVLNLASKMTVQQMLERDMFKRRTEEGKPIFIHEFMYPLMQGYDSVAMDVDGELGGNDQIFNMLCGRDLMKTIKNKEKFVVAVKLLEDNTGKKMGKSDGNMSALSDTAEQMYGSVMSWNDSLMISSFELCTNIPMSEIEKIAIDVKSEKINPRDLKMRLAREITTIYHGEKKAKQAEETFINTFQKKEIPTDIENILVKKSTLLVDVFLSNKMISSKSDFRRLVEEGAITNLDLDKKVLSYNDIAEDGVYRIGKKRFCKIIIN
jgi:tyrosyl-tRNA synthetase